MPREAHANVDNLCFDEWNDRLFQSCGHYYGVPNKRTIKETGDFRLHDWLGIDVANIKSKAEKIERTRKGIEKDDQQHIFILKQIQGATRIHHNGYTSKLESGDLLLLDSTKPAELIFHKTPSHFLSVHLPRAEFMASCKSKVDIGRIRTATSTQGRTLNAAFPQLENFADDTQANPQFLSELTQIAFQKADRRYSATRLSMAKYRFQIMLQLIDQNLADSNFTLEHLAKEAKVSPRQAQRDFHNNNTQFSTLLTERRLKLAQEKLRRCCRNGQAPHIAQIAFESGFGDVSHFNHMFKRHFDQTPTEFMTEFKQELFN